MAERQGFEPWIPCGIHAFQACAFSHSAISPFLADFHESTTIRRGKAATNRRRYPSFVEYPIPDNTPRIYAKLSITPGSGSSS